MSYLSISKQCVLSLLLITSTAQTAAPTYTPSNTAVFVQGYNVIYKNDTPKIISKCALFLAKNPSLFALLVNPTFLSAIRNKWKQGSRLAEFYEIFNTYDSSNRILPFAQKLLVEGKSPVHEGIKTVNDLIESDYKVIILTGQDEAQNAEFKKAFPIMAHPNVDVISSYEPSIEYYSLLKNASGKEHAILLYGNKDHHSVTSAENAGFIIKHFNENIIA